MPGLEESRVTSPYLGLVPFREQDAPFFFGREQATRIIISNQFASRLTLLYGASGVGKSSVLRAGVAHQLRTRAAEAVESGEPPPALAVYFNEWQGDVSRRLAASIRQASSHFDNGTEFSNGGSLARLVSSVTDRLDTELFLIFDQFEEYFLYHPSEGGPGSFADELVRTINDPGLTVSFLLSLRDDSLAKLDRFKTDIPRLFANRLRLDHLSTEAARDSILKPIEVYNRLPESRRLDGRQIEVEPALVEQVLRQVGTGRVLLGGVGQGRITGNTLTGIETPYLQLVLTKIWETETTLGSSMLRRATLDQLGGAERIVNDHLEGVMSRVSEDEREVCASIFEYLVTPSGAKIGHTAEDLAVFAGLEPDALEPILQRLSHSGMRILTPVAPPPDQQGSLRYEIYHDSLGAAILDWRRRFVEARQKARQEAERQAAAEEHRRELERQRQLTEAQRQKAEAEEARATEQARAARKLRRLVVLLAVVTVAALIASSLAVWRTQQRDQEREGRIEQEKEAEAQRQRAEAEKQRREAAEKDRLAAIARAQGNEEKARQLERERDTALAQAEESSQAADLLDQEASLERRLNDETTRADSLASQLASARDDLDKAQETIGELTRERDTLDGRVRELEAREDDDEQPPPPPSNTRLAESRPRPPHKSSGRDISRATQLFEDAMLERGDPARVASLLGQAIALDPDNNGRPVRVRDDFIVPYRPFYRLGKAYFELGNCAAAIWAWEEAELRSQSTLAALVKEDSDPSNGIEACWDAP